MLAEAIDVTEQERARPREPTARWPIERVTVPPGRFRRRMGDLAALAESIGRLGMLHPVVVTPEGTLVAGARRLAAARRLGWTEVPVTVVELDDLLGAEFAENTQRLDFTPTEAVAIGLALEERERERARERLRRGAVRGGMAHGGAGAHGVPQPRPSEGPQEASVNFTEPSYGHLTPRQLAGLAGRPPMWGNEPLAPPERRRQTRDVVGPAVGMSGATYHAARTVVRRAGADPERFGRYAEEMDRTGRVWPAYLRMTAERDLEDTATGRQRRALDRAAQARALARQGHHVDDIATALGVAPQAVRRYLAAGELAPPAGRLRVRPGGIDHAAAFERLVAGFEVPAVVLHAIDWEALPLERFDDWARRLTAAAEQLGNLRRRLGRQSTRGGGPR